MPMHPADLVFANFRFDAPCGSKSKACAPSNKFKGPYRPDPRFPGENTFAAARHFYRSR